MGRNMHVDSAVNLGPEAIRLKYRASSSVLSGSALSSSPTSASPIPLGPSSPLTRSRESSSSIGGLPRVSRNVGDLLSMTMLDESSSSISVSPDKSSIPLPSDEDPTSNPRRTGSRNLSFAIGPADEFDLRDEVMTCISRSIGLTQPSTSISPSIDSSPVLTAQDPSLKRAVFSSSFGSLSYLGIQARDDESSITGSSTTGGLEGMDIENETEILFFPRDSTLCKAGERGPGLFFVIEGWLDVLMPESHTGSLGKLADNNENQKPTQKPTPLKSASHSRHGSQPVSRSGSTSRNSSHDPNLGTLPATGPKASKPLFSVKPGSIAGYLSSLSGFPSYVDIKAKTDVYFGFLPARALDRIMDRRPIVLLTLAKRLISLLPPLVVHIDSALEWMQVNAGQVIYRQDEKADSFYFVNQGRLRSIADKEGHWRSRDIGRVRSGRQCRRTWVSNSKHIEFGLTPLFSGLYHRDASALYTACD